MEWYSKENIGVLSGAFKHGRLNLLIFWEWKRRAGIGIMHIRTPSCLLRATVVDTVQIWPKHVNTFSTPEFSKNTSSVEEKWAFHHDAETKHNITEFKKDCFITDRLGCKYNVNYYRKTAECQKSQYGSSITREDLGKGGMKDGYYDDEHRIWYGRQESWAQL